MAGSVRVCIAQNPLFLIDIDKCLILRDQNRAESQGHNSQVPCPEDKRSVRGLICEQGTLCYSTLTTGILSQSQCDFIFVVWPKKIQPSSW